MLGNPRELKAGDRYRLEPNEPWLLVKKVTKPKDGFVRVNLSDGRKVALDETTTVQMRGENK
jgi:hypothetical protein